MNKRIIIVPGGFQYVKNYGGYDGVDIWLKSSPKNLPTADYYIGHSGGVNFILSHYDSIHSGKFIFINPLIRKRNILSLLWNWIKFFFIEGIRRKKIVPINNWLYGFKLVLKLLKVDVFGIIQKIPKEKFFIIKGKNDVWFCDKKSAEMIRNSGIKLIEVDAGHDWNQNIAETVKKFIDNSNIN